MPISDEGRLRALCAERKYFEDAIVRRFGSTLSREDAEDVVSESLLASAQLCPEDARDGGRAWFMRVILNKAEDYRRARDGRPRSARGKGADSRATSRRFVSVDDDVALTLVDDGETPSEAAERRADQRALRSSIGEAMATLPPQQAEVIRLRHMADHGDGRPRAEVAQALGLSLAKYEAVYTAAGRQLRSALVSAVPTDACAQTREALTSPAAASGTRSEVDAHIAGCWNCRLHRRQLRKGSMGRLAA